MIFLIIFMFLSLFLDGIFSRIIPFNDIYLYKTFLSIISIIIIYPYYAYEKKSYFILVFIFGFFYDLLYTNMLLLSPILFLIISIVTIELYKILKNNVINSIVICIIDLFLYNLLTYFVLSTFGIHNISLSIFLSQLVFINIINIIFFFIVYIILKLLQDKLKIKGIA